VTTVLFAPDSFKGSLTSVAVAQALAKGWARARPEDRTLLAPLADGGEGTLEAIASAGGWRWQTDQVRDPLGRQTPARWLCSDDGRRAVIEMAESSGLSRLRHDERDAVGATSAGIGDLISRVAASGVEDVIIGIGGSATTDGGFGMLAALLMDWSPGEHDLPRGIPPDLGEVRLDRLEENLRRLAVRVACDVSNPLLGASGAAAVYGPQKGASPEQVELLDGRLARLAEALERASGRRERDTPGAGAAGGVGFALLTIQEHFREFALQPGVDLVIEATGFDDKLATADLVVTGEGRVDAQTAFGKTAMGVARRAHEAGKPSIAVGGGVTPEGIDALAPFGTVVVPVVEGPQTIEAAIAAGAEPVERAGERIARLVGLGGGA
jgi:glycerate 2-kinase